MRSNILTTNPEHRPETAVTTVVEETAYAQGIGLIYD